jgi:hypothetical protein
VEAEIVLIKSPKKKLAVTPGSGQNGVRLPCVPVILEASDQRKETP